MWPVRSVLNAKNNQKHKCLRVGVRLGAPQNAWENIFQKNRQRTILDPRNRFSKIPERFKPYARFVRAKTTMIDVALEKSIKYNNDVDKDLNTRFLFAF